MTLEQLGSSMPVRFALSLVLRIINVISCFQSKFPSKIARKILALFSVRVNNILHENLFVYAKNQPPAQVNAEYVACNTLVEVKLDLNIRDYTQGHFYFSGLPGFFLEVLAFTNERTAFFDIGANMGIISSALSQFIPEKNIVAVEAMPEAYHRLKKVFNDNCPGALAINTALSSKQGVLHFNIPSSDSGSASASLTANELILDRKHGIQVLSHNVLCETFDTLYSKINLLNRFSSLDRHAFKIDVEGHEVDVIQGMKVYLSEFKGALLVVVEVRPHTHEAVHAILSESGFTAIKPEKPMVKSLQVYDIIYKR
jgi:FkbM family methyltransferase